MSEKPKLFLTLRARESSAAFSDLPFASEQENDFADPPSSSAGTIAKNKDIKVTGAALSIHDVLRFEGHEQLSKPFFFQLYVRLEKDAKVPKNIAGNPLSIEFVNEQNAHLRYFHGRVAWAEEMEAPLPDGFREVSLGVCSTFEMLSLTEDVRPFLEMKTIDIIEHVLREKKVDFDNKVKSAGKNKREFCVQYRESHFHFVSRLMEEEGIFYFFKFEKEKHVLVLADDISVYENFGEALPFWRASPEGSLFSNRIWRFKRHQRNVLQKISLNDYFFKSPEQNLLVKEERRETLPLESYDYPGRFQESNPRRDLENLAKSRLQAVESTKVLYKGLSTALKFSAGVKFSLKTHPQEEFNGRYVVLSVHHFYDLNPEGTPLFQNTFKAIPESTPFHPLEKTPKPFATQDTATVMGRKGQDDEIYTDKEFRRIKVKFHWDRRPDNEVKDEDRSYWIRVASGWAGRGWGMLHTPRVGQEVVITYLNNNPDRPLVIGSVYNSSHKPPYLQEGVDLTKSTLRSVSTKKGQPSENYNEIRFTDAKGKEEVFVQAEKDVNVLVKDSVDTKVGGNTETKISGNRTVTIGAKLDHEAKDKKKGDDFLTLEKGTRTVELKGKPGHLHTKIAQGNNTLEIQKGNNETTITTGDIKISITKGSKKITLTKGDYTLTLLKGDVKITTTGKCTIDAMKGIDLKTLQEVKVTCSKFTVNALADIKMTAAMKFSAQGMAQASLASAAMTEVKAGAMASVKAAIVMLN